MNLKALVGIGGLLLGMVIFALIMATLIVMRRLVETTELLRKVVEGKVKIKFTKKEKK